MNTSINAKTLRASLPDVIKRVQEGARFTVIYRGRPAFQIAPLGDAAPAPGPLADDPLFEAGPIGSSSEGQGSVHLDELLYSR